MSGSTDDISQTTVNQGNGNSLEDLLKQELVSQAEFLLHELVTSADNSLTTAQLGAIAKVLQNLKGIAQLTQMELLAELITWLIQQVELIQSNLISQGNSAPLTALPSEHPLIAGLHWLQQISRVPGAEIMLWLEQNYDAMRTIMTQNSSNLRGISVAESSPIPSKITSAISTSEQPEIPHIPIESSNTMVDGATLDSDPAMIELFRLEVEEQSKILNQVLLTLEAQQHAPQSLEALMRAAHSVKGAARIVSLDMAVKLAHSMEDAFVAAQNQKITLTADDIDILLHAVDLLSGISQRESQNLVPWLNSQSPNFEATLGYISTITQTDAQGNSIRSIIQQQPVPPIANTANTNTTSSLIAPQPHHITANAITETIPTVNTPPIPTTVKVTTVPHEKTHDLANNLANNSANNKDRVVRVSAENLNRIMGLAGESLIEANWLSPYADSLMILKKRQLELSKLWENFKHNFELTQTENHHLMIDAINQKERECREILADRFTELELFARRTGNLSDRLYREVIASHMRPFDDGVQSFPRMVRDVARGLGKQVHLEIVGKATPVDRDILTKLEAPLTHILRNGVDHGIEIPEERLAKGKPAEGKIRLEAMHRGGMLSITITDDGKGIDLDWLKQKIVSKNLSPLEMVTQMSEAELLEFLFLPGFSTAAAVTEISGRGVGLDIAKSMADQVGGTVRVSTQIGKGTVFHFQLPLTLSVVRTLLVEIANEPYAFPLARIEQVVMVQQSQIGSMENRQYFTMNERHIGLISAAQVLELKETTLNHTEDLAVVVVSEQTDYYGLVVDRFLGEHDLVVRPIDQRLGKVQDISAAALMGDGSPILILDVADLIRSTNNLLNNRLTRRLNEPKLPLSGKQSKQILVVDDSLTVREMERKLLENQGYQVEVAVDGIEGWYAVSTHNYDLVISDIDMPRMNGIELVKKIKTTHKLAHIPVIIVSYKDREEDRINGLQAGANYYLTKASFHDNSLIKAVTDLLGQ